MVGGENSKRLDLGIYVKSVTEGGPAWKDGRLKAGTVRLCKDKKNTVRMRSCLYNVNFVYATASLVYLVAF